MVKWVKRYVNGAYRRFLVDTTTLETLDADYPVKLIDDFVGPIEIDATNAAVVDTGRALWNYTIVNGGTATDVADADACGCMALTTGNADDDDVEIATGLVFKAEMAPIIEVRCANEDISQLCHFIGFTDAVAEAADLLPFGTGAVLADNVVSTATNGAGWIWDPDLTTDYLCCVSVNADADGANYTTSTALTDGQWATYRVQINTAGDAEFYLNGVLIYTELLAVATTASLCGYVGIINHPGATDVLNVDYIRIWADRPT